MTIKIDSYEGFKRKAVIRQLGLDDYKYIQDNYLKLNISEISENNDFQKKFNHFYKVRRNENWRKVYYKYFETVKDNKNVTFSEILEYLNKNLPNNPIEASFASKMLATINPEKPIWDQFVVEKLNIKVPNKRTIGNSTEIYEKIERRINDLVKENGETIEKFKEEFGEYELKDVKIIDFILWNDRTEDETEYKK